MLVKRIFNKWIFNENVVTDKIKKSNLDENNFGVFRDFLIGEALKNKKFEKYFLKELAANGSARIFFQNGLFSRNYFLNKVFNIINKIFGYSNNCDNILVDCDDVVKYINENNLLMCKKEFIEKVHYYTSSLYIKDKLQKKHINEKFTYLDLINFFKESRLEDSFFFGDIDDKEGVNDKFEGLFGLSIDMIDELFSKNPLNIYRYDSVIYKLGFTNEEVNNIKENVKKIKLFNIIKKGKEYVINNTLSKVLTNQISLNSSLKEKVLSKLPNHFSLMQKAYFIYKLLCFEFVYDEEFYYLNYAVPRKNHLDISRLSTLSGGEEIICTGFSLIYAKFLEELKIPFSLLNYDNEIISKLTFEHMKVRFYIDNYLIDADGADDLTKSDMTNQKILNRVNNFNMIVGTREMQKKFEEEKREIDEYFETISKNLDVDMAISMYRQMYFNNGNHEKMQISFEERVALLLDILRLSKLKIFDMLILTKKIRENLFSDNIGKILIEFIVNKTIGLDEDYRYNLNILIAYNEKNDLYDDFFSNKYVVINQDKKLEYLTYDKLRRRFSTLRYRYTDDSRSILNIREGVFYDDKQVEGRFK